jgi:hypothetical protein
MRTAALLMALAGMLACGGLADVSEINVRVTGVPQFVCPTSTPVPTATQHPTAVQPTVYYPPSGWVTTYRQDCTWVWNGYTYIENCVWVPDGGYYQHPAYTDPGPTSTPRPTHTPYPTPTPYVVTENYAMGADVHVGDPSALALRLRVDRPQVYPVSGEQQVVAWEVQVENIGAVPYNTLPGAQTFVGEVGGVSGHWYASAEAAQAANLVLDPTALDIAVVEPGRSLSLTVTAFTPTGPVGAVGWLLDPYSGGVGGGVVGGNTALWRNQADPHGCDRNVGGGFRLPTPAGASPTPTASVTPWVPPYAGATRAP